MRYILQGKAFLNLYLCQAQQKLDFQEGRGTDFFSAKIEAEGFVT